MANEKQQETKAASDSNDGLGANEAKGKRIDDFLTLLHKMNCNKVNADNGYEDVFGPGMPFAIVCNKCGSMDIEVIGERGVDYGGRTGYSPGSTVVKCNGCGNAVTAWE